MRIPKTLHCKNCDHLFYFVKRRKVYQCSSCGKRGTIGGNKKDNFQIYLLRDYTMILKLFRSEPHTIETLRAGQMIVDAEARGEVIKIGKKKVKKKTTRSQDPVKKLRNKSKKKSPEYEYCYYAEWCKDPKQDLQEGTHLCSKNRDECYNKAKKKYQE